MGLLRSGVRPSPERPGVPPKVCPGCWGRMVVHVWRGHDVHVCGSCRALWLPTPADVNQVMDGAHASHGPADRRGPVGVVLGDVEQPSSWPSRMRQRNTLIGAAAVLVAGTAAAALVAAPRVVASVARTLTAECVHAWDCTVVESPAGAVAMPVTVARDPEKRARRVSAAPPDAPRAVTSRPSGGCGTDSQDSRPSAVCTTGRCVIHTPAPAPAADIPVPAP